MSEEKAVARAAWVVGAWTAVSRVLGFVRDMVIALFLGAGVSADAFFVAFRIPNLLRRLVAEGALSAAFVPTFVDTLHKEGRDEAARLAQITFTFTTIVMAVITVLGIVFSPGVVRLIAPGFHGEASKFLLTVDLNRIMFVYIFFMSLVALAAGVLNTMGHFAAPAAAPVLLNLSMIISVGVFSTFFQVQPSYALAWGVVVAGLLQLALQLPFMWKHGIRLRPDLHFRHAALRRIGILFVPAALAGAVYQLNVFVGTILASLLISGSVSWLYYTDRLVELPLGIFGITLGVAALPSMSRQASNGDLHGLAQSVSFSLRLIAFFTIPASVALILLREPIISLLFQRGLFTYFDTQQTAHALFWYTVGLPAFSGLKVVTQAFYATKDTKTPFWVSAVAVAVNLGAGLLLMGPMAHGGLALATSLSAWFSVSVLFWILVRRLGQFPGAEFGDSLLRTSGAALVMAMPLCYVIYVRQLGHWPHGLTNANLSILVACVVGGLLIFVAGAWLFRCRELRFIMSALTRRKL